VGESLPSLARDGAGRTTGREDDFDVQAAGGECRAPHDGAVRGGDRFHDRKSEAKAVVVGSGRAVEAPSLERLKETFHFPGRDNRAAVRDPDEALAVLRGGGHIDPAIGHVVSESIVDEIGHQALSQLRVANGDGRSQRGVDAQAPALRLPDAVGHHLADHVGQIEELTVLQSPLATGQGEQSLDDLLLLPARGQQVLARGPQ
jgi:hypothetical protein